MRIVTSLPAFGIATIMALAGLGLAPHPVTATDPSPTPVPTAEETPSPSPDPSSSPELSPSPEPSAEPTPSPSPEPSATPEPTPTPDPTPAPSAPAEATAPADTSPTKTELLREKYLRAARIAIRQRDDRYVAGGTGPNVFDCSGLVRYAYKQAGIGGRLGGGHSARAMLEWAREHDKIRKRHPKIGDVVIWGNGRHAGIYVGNGRAISALNPRQDIRILGIHRLTDPFTAFIRTRP